MHERSPWQLPFEVNKFLVKTFEFLSETNFLLGNTDKSGAQSEILHELEAKHHYLMDRLQLERGKKSQLRLSARK